MAHMNVHPALSNEKISVFICNINGDHSLSISTNYDTVSLLLSTNDLNTLFGSLNNYLETLEVNA